MAPFSPSPISHIKCLSFLLYMIWHYSKSIFQYKTVRPWGRCSTGMNVMMEALVVWILQQPFYCYIWFTITFNSADGLTISFLALYKFPKVHRMNFTIHVFSLKKKKRKENEKESFWCHFIIIQHGHWQLIITRIQTSVFYKQLFTRLLCTLWVWSGLLSPSGREQEEHLGHRIAKLVKRAFN